jgi:hypothetical protein
MRSLLLASLLLPASAFAAGLASRPAGESYERSSLEGIYASIAAGGQLMIDSNSSSNAFGYDAEARIGYSFGVQLQLSICGALDSSNFNGNPVHVEQLAVCLQYHFLARPQVMVYGRGGIGVSLSSDVLGPNNGTGAGLMEVAGIGVEIRVASGVYLAPELFYKNESFASQGNSDSIGIVGMQVGLVYY